ncbi:MAG: VOC family protein [Planctomycetota bacterium]|nr:VOC family protein [Planctomycetota bacterium]
MSKLIGSSPLFHVSDVEKSANHYREVFGFDYSKIWGEPPCFCMPRLDGFIVMLSQVDDASKIKTNGALDGTGETWDAYFWCDDAYALFDEFRSKGAEIAYEPIHRDYYGMMEFAVRDGDGYTLAFGQDWTGK